MRPLVSGKHNQAQLCGCVDTVGLDSEMIRKYVKFQEKEELHQQQLELKAS